MILRSFKCISCILISFAKTMKPMMDTNESSQVKYIKFKLLQYSSLLSNKVLFKIILNTIILIRFLLYLRPSN